MLTFKFIFLHNSTKGLYKEIAVWTQIVTSFNSFWRPQLLRKKQQLLFKCGEQAVREWSVLELLTAENVQILCQGTIGEGLTVTFCWHKAYTSDKAFFDTMAPIGGACRGIPLTLPSSRPNFPFWALGELLTAATVPVLDYNRFHPNHKILGNPFSSLLARPVRLEVTTT